MAFFNRVPQIMEVQDFYKALYPDYKDHGGFGLAKVCERVLKKKLCKKEQMSNWENRPLRFSQEHYAAMDAWILPEIIMLMDKKAKQEKSKHQLSTFIRSYTSKDGLQDRNTEEEKTGDGPQEMKKRGSKKSADAEPVTI